MRARSLLMVASCVAAILSPSVQAAAALEPGWPLPGPADAVLGFGESYVSADGSVSVHRGVDLVAAAGSAVTAVLDGTVTFAGRVPAGEGATTIAVTVESGDVRLTYMPLSESAVAAGDSVRAGARLGALAASGDRSSVDPHLHLSARRGSLYIDPLPFLLAPAAPTGGEASEPVPAPAVTTPAAATVVAHPAPVTAAATVPATRVQPAASTGVAAPSTVAVGEGANVASRVQAAVTGGTHSPMVSAGTAPAGAAAPETKAGAVTTATQPARMRGNAAGMIPDAGLSALAVDRRAEAMSRMPVPPAAIVAIAGVLGAGLLWPIWRSVPAPGVAVTAKRQDVAAVVAR